MDQRRRSLLLGLAAIGAAPPSLAQSSKLPRVALLDPAENVAAMNETHPRWGSLLGGLRSLGYIKGKTLAVEPWSGGTDAARYPALCKKVADSRPDVVVAYGATMISSLAAATKSLPIVGVGTIPRELGKDFANPGANVTGLNVSFDEQVYVKLAEFARQVTKPGARIAWLGLRHLWDGMLGRAAREGAQRTGLEIRPILVQTPVTPATVRAAFATKDMKADGLYVAPAIELRSHIPLIGELARTARLPSVSAFYDDADAGLLLSYGADLPDTFRRAAHYVDRILKGTKPGDIPIELPTKFLLVINRKIAKAIGVTLPQELLLRADRVIN